MNAQYTRTGARRSGDDYQDLVALEVLAEWLEHPDRYQWVRVEADDAGVLDDIVALKSDDGFVAKQVKFSTRPESESDAWTWKDLLERRKGKKEELPSLLAKWATSLERLQKSGKVSEACLVSNRKPAPELKNALSPNGLVDFNKITDSEIRDEIARQIGSEALARSFFSAFHFYLDKPGLDVLEDSVRRRFYDLGGKNQGWLNLKNDLRFWVRHKDQPSPDGAIELKHVRSAALWYKLQSLPQKFEVPQDYVLPSQDFHKGFMDELLKMKGGCLVLTASPGVGKSTYLSYLFEKLIEQEIPVVRHHYFLSLSDRTVGRSDHERVIESLMSDIQKSFPDSLGRLGDANPDSVVFTTWIEASGRYFAQQQKALIIIIDGLDYVWREKVSFDEANRLFERLLPTPDGVVVLLGTQPLDESQLPSRLRRSAPLNQWIGLPLLDHAAVESWLLYHKDELDLPKEAHGRNFILDRLVNALYQKSQGHPLHLRYTLKALQEQNLPITKENIERLPGCTHQDITKYYEELWLSLPEEGRQILHLFAASPFPWPPKGIIECLAPQAQNSAQVHNALRQIRHLLRPDTLGLRPFHTSLLVFIVSQRDHQVYSQRMKRLALDWVRTKASEYWRWANEWLLEADLCDDRPLISGPSRQWTVEAISKRYPRQEVCEILGRSGWSALQREDLPRCVKVGLLRDYFNNIYEFRSEVFDELLHPQLIIEEDLHLRDRLSVNTGSLTHNELVFLAENEALRGNQLLVHECFLELYERAKGARIGPKGEALDDWRSVVGPTLKVAALDNEIAPAKIVDLAVRIRKYGWACDALGIYADALRVARNVRPLREMLKMVDMSDLERSIIFRHAVLLAFEEDLDLASEVRLAESSVDPFAAIYAALRKVANFELGSIQFPSTELLSLQEYEHYRHRGDIEELFYVIFFCFLGNHLWQQGKHNEEWLQGIGGHSWPRSFLHRLNTIASDLAGLLLSNSPPLFSWFYEQVKGFTRPKWLEDRDVYEYGSCAERAINYIALDILLLAKALERPPEITKDDLQLAFTSDYCHPRIWMNAYIARRRKWLSEEAVNWLLQEQEEQFASSIELFSERASSYNQLASLAALHGLKDEAQLYVREAASNLISYGDHKDILLYGAFEVIEACHKANIPEARQWLLQLAPAIAGVKDFTDGDETRHLPRQLGSLLAEVDPDLLPVYYQWLCIEEEYYDALSVLHSFLKTADLSSEINQALAKTAVDDESLTILAERAEKGDEGAQTALSSLMALLRHSPVNKTESKESENESKAIYSSDKQPMPPPADFPPDKLTDYLSAVKGRSFYQIKECIADWLEFWKNAGKAEEAFRAVKEEVDRGIDVGNYDALFALALSLYGKERAYPWLVRAHTERYGWSRYAFPKEEALRRWKMVKKHYPGWWFRFIQDTMKSAYGEPWSRLTAYERFVRLVEYCLFMGQKELAKQVAEKVIACTLELVSPVALSIPGWVNEA